MATDFDATEFVDEDFEAARKKPLQSSTPMTPFSDDPRRAPTREEVDSKVSELQTRLADLKRAQGDLERERAALEETRRRQIEFTTSREELIRDLSRGIQLLEERELATRRDAEQMARALVDLKDGLVKLQDIQQETWSKENLNADLSRAMGVADHARMEWNSARLKFPFLSGEPGASPDAPTAAQEAALPLAERTFLELCKLGLAFTWPIALAALAIFFLLLFR